MPRACPSAALQPRGSVGVGATDRLSKLTVKGDYPFTATGTVSVTNGLPTVTGSGTKFKTEVRPGDNISVTISGTTYTKTVIRVVDDFNLIVNSTFTTSGSSLSMTVASFNVSGTKTTTPSGTVTVTSPNLTTVVGSGTYFMTDVALGDQIKVTVSGTDYFRTVTAIADDTHLTVSSNLPAIGSPGVGITVNSLDISTFTFGATGTATASAGSTTVNGSGTKFATEITVGDRISIGGGETKIVVAIDGTNPNTILYVNSAFGSAQSGSISVTSFDISGNVSITGGSPTTVTGTGTRFTTELGLGDRITVATSSGSETRTVKTIGSDTSLTVDSAFAGTTSSAPMGAISGIFRADDASGTPCLFVSDQGNVGVGTVTPHSRLAVIGLPVYANNAAAITGGLAAGDLYRTGADPDPVMVVH